MRTTNRTQHCSFKAVKIALATVVLGSVATFAYTPEARADEVSPTGKGMVGGGLLGAEVVTITEALVGVRNPLWYVVGGVAGAGGGVVVGYFVEQGSTDGRVPMYMLAGGLGLVIPALVLTLNATRYRPSEDATEDRAPTNEPNANPGQVGGTSVLGTQPTAPQNTTPAMPPAAGGGGTTPSPVSPSSTPPPPPQSLLDFHFGGAVEKVRMGVPVPEVRPMYSAREQQQMGLPSQTELRVPVLHVVF